MFIFSTANNRQNQNCHYSSSKLSKSGKRRLQRASTPVTPRPTTTDSPIEGHSPRHRQITPNRLQRRLHRTTTDLRFQQPNQNYKPPDAATHNTHHSQQRFGFTAAKAAPQPVSSSSAPATVHSTIIAPPPLTTDRAIDLTGGNHHLQQTTVVLAFSSHACAASNNT